MWPDLRDPSWKYSVRVEPFLREVSAPESTLQPEAAWNQYCDAREGRQKMGPLHGRPHPAAVTALPTYHIICSSVLQVGVYSFPKTVLCGYGCRYCRTCNS